MRVGTTVLNDVPGQKAPVAMHFEIDRYALRGVRNDKREGGERKKDGRTNCTRVDLSAGRLFVPRDPRFPFILFIASKCSSFVRLGLCGNGT